MDCTYTVRMDKHICVVIVKHDVILDLPDTSLEYWRDGWELVSLEMAVVRSGCDPALDRLPRDRPHRSQRDLRSPSITIQEP